MKRKLSTLLLCLPLLCTCERQRPLPELPTEGFKDGIHHWNLLHQTREYSRLQTTQTREIADNLISYQNPDGGWPKNLDLLAVLNADSVKAALTDRYRESTLDNRNTFPQIEYLAQVYTLTNEKKYGEAAEKGIRYLLDTQNPSGGWRGWDVDAITFNDEVTTGAMDLMYRVHNRKEPYAWIHQPLAEEARTSFERALDVTLRCQIVIDGEKTAWCQQHDHITLEPVGARTYELPCITPNESSDIVLFLMSLPEPDERIKDAVQSAVTWLHRSQLRGGRIEKVEVAPEEITNHEYPYDLVMVQDPAAKPIWARFYEVNDEFVPFMANRDGIKVYRLQDVLPERRMGYSWYGYWPEKVFEAYPEWNARNGGKR